MIDHKAVLATKTSFLRLVILGSCGSSSSFPRLVIPSNARDLGVCRLGALQWTQARTRIPRSARDDTALFATSRVVAFVVIGPGHFQECGFDERTSATGIHRERVGDQILRMRVPGGPPEGAREIGDRSLWPVTGSGWIASSSDCTAGCGEKTAVVKAEV
jgi:hypothetical protein